MQVSCNIKGRTADINGAVRVGFEDINCLPCIVCFIPLRSSYFLLGPYFTCPYLSGLYGSCQLPMTRIVDEQVVSLLSNKVTYIRNNSSLVNIRRLTPIIPFWFRTSKLNKRSVQRTAMKSSCPWEFLDGTTIDYPIFWERSKSRIKGL